MRGLGHGKDAIMEGRAVPGTSHARITLLFSPLSASTALICSLSLSRADSHTPTHIQPYPHATPTQRYRYQGPGCLHRRSVCRSQHGLDIKFHDSKSFSMLSTLLSQSHSQTTSSPTPSHAPGHLLRGASYVLSPTAASCKWSFDRFAVLRKSYCY